MGILNGNMTLGAVFGGMLFLVWILPGIVCRKGCAPEDHPPRKRSFPIPSTQTP
jgi:hypothetical protein